MNKGRFFTLVMLFLSIAVIFGGWFLVKELLRDKEQKLLGRSGQISMQTAEFILQEKERNQQKEEAGFQETILSDDSIEFVLNAWEEGGYVILHEPQKGQMSMEQAITTGRVWISSLSEQGILPSFFQEEYSFNEISANLSSLDVQTDFEKSLLSFWNICYIGDDVSIFLKIHAESGQVWNADISILNGKMPYEEINEKMYVMYHDGILMETLFPFLKEKKKIPPVVDSYNTILKEMGEGSIFAGIQWDMFILDSGEPITDIAIWLCTKNSSEYWNNVKRNEDIEPPISYYNKSVIVDKAEKTESIVEAEEKNK